MTRCGFEGVKYIQGREALSHALPVSYMMVWMSLEYQACMSKKTIGTVTR
jgi:hypothetical protein